MDRHQKTITILLSACAVAVAGIGYNAVRLHLDNSTLAKNTAFYAALEAAPPTHSMIMVDGKPMYQKCEQGWCTSSAFEADLQGSKITKSTSPIPTVDLAYLASVVRDACIFAKENPNHPHAAAMQSYASQHGVDCDHLNPVKEG